MPSRACDQCRIRKVKCEDTTGTSCAHCIKRQQTCTRIGTSPRQGLKPESQTPSQPQSPPLPDAEILAMDEKLIDYFIAHHNPNFGDFLDQPKLKRIRSQNPTPSETFLFFCICTISAVDKMLGPAHRVSHYYMSHVKNLKELPSEFRDNLYYEALTLLDLFNFP